VCVGLVGRVFVRETKQRLRCKRALIFLLLSFSCFVLAPERHLTRTRRVCWINVDLDSHTWCAHWWPEHCSHISSYNGNVNGMETLRRSRSDFVKTQNCRGWKIGLESWETKEWRRSLNFNKSKELK
jgi:hypothetical protein